MMRLFPPAGLALKPRAYHTRPFRGKKFRIFKKRAGKFPITKRSAFFVINVKTYQKS